MMLGVDLIGETLDTDHADITQLSFTNEKWCSMPLTLLSNTKASHIQRQVLEGMIQLVSHCSFDHEDIANIDFSNDSEIEDLVSRLNEQILQK